jgi:ribulose-5-phosphate 4-epimerase/fuculose-1-phosphate aldolase
VGTRNLSGGRRAGLFEDFRAAGRTLFSLGLVRGAEGNLSAFDGERLVITRTGAELRSIVRGDLIGGSLEGDLEGASSDLEVHRAMYRKGGEGAVAHAHPPGSVPGGGGAGAPGAHGVYVFGPSLQEAVEGLVRRARGMTE